jgi:hypothetical protein
MPVTFEQIRKEMLDIRNDRKVTAIQMVEAYSQDMNSIDKPKLVQCFIDYQKTGKLDLEAVRDITSRMPSKEEREYIREFSERLVEGDNAGADLSKDPPLEGEDRDKAIEKWNEVNRKMVDCAIQERNRLRSVRHQTVRHQTVRHQTVRHQSEEKIISSVESMAAGKINNVDTELSRREREQLTENTDKLLGSFRNGVKLLSDYYLDNANALRTEEREILKQAFKVYEKTGNLELSENQSKLISELDPELKELIKILKNMEKAATGLKAANSKDEVANRSRDLKPPCEALGKMMDAVPAKDDNMAQKLRAGKEELVILTAYMLAFATSLACPPLGMALLVAAVLLDLMHTFQPEIKEFLGERFGSVVREGENVSAVADRSAIAEKQMVSKFESGQTKKLPTPTPTASADPQPHNKAKPKL